MHSLLLLRQSLRSGINFARVSPSYPSGRAQFPPTTAAVVPKALDRLRTARSFSVCCRCQFRSQYTALYGAENKDQSKDEQVVGEVNTNSNSSSTTPTTEGTPKPDDLDFDLQRKFHISGNDGKSDLTEQGQQQQASDAHAAKTGKQEEEEERGSIYDSNIDVSATGRLPSSVENRRSQFSKKFSSLMDDLQSNIFVAGQHLNDLTGYSSIESLKKEIQEQEARVRGSRARVREAKDSYAAAINRRSTSQREVNELLQRKHAWSPMDLERFTSLYRNDHTNEVAESEAQQTLTSAEQEAEEAAAQLSKCILSRYHEEQVWSDKIRRMSTWGTWGLMGVNVLLFLVFQIAVEPWRRRRLVTGFEEKVMEALEKEKTTSPEAVAAAAGTQAAANSTKSNTETAEDERPVLIDAVPPSPDEEDLSTTANDFDTIITEQGPTTKKKIPSVPEATPSTATTSTTATTVNNKIFAFLESCKSQLSRMRHPPALDSSLDYVQDCFSDHTIVISKSDVTNAAIQGVAVGAAVTGLVFALFRSW